MGKEVFNEWLKDPEMLTMLEEVEIETCTKFELFDVLDVDMGGELELDELITGLMKLRGPISKSDIVATRLKVRHVTKMMEDVWRKLGCDLDQAEEDVSRRTELRSVHNKVGSHSVLENQDRVGNSAPLFTDGEHEL